MRTRLNRLRWPTGEEAAHAGAPDPAVMARTFAYLFGTGATMVLVALALPHAQTRNPLGSYVAAGAAYLVTAAMLVAYERVPLWIFNLLPGAGSVLITLLCATGGHEAVLPYALFYFWVVLSAFFFLRPAVALAHLAIAIASLLAVLELRPDWTDLPALSLLMATGTLVVAGLMIGALRGRVDRLVSRLADAARSDPLTGLLNRRGFEERFDQERERALRSGRELTLIVVDVDHFKTINDRFGHAAGDRVLQRTAQILSGASRTMDTVCRMGGEEFAVLVPEAGQHEAYLLAERLRREVALEFSDFGPTLTISLGVASYPSHGSTWESIMGAADQAMYLAKDLGRDRTVIYSAEAASTLRAAELRNAGERRANLATVLGLADVLDLRHPATARHSETVGRLTKLIAEAVGLPSPAVERVRLAGVLHDIGKIGIPDRILFKPAPLDAGEWKEMRSHPEIGSRILHNAGLDDIADWVVAHHERADGGGYPRGLSGERIPLEARILAVADAYEAMTATRPYRDGMAPQLALDELRRHAGTQFDADIVGIFVALMSAAPQMAAVGRGLPNKPEEQPPDFEDVARLPDGDS